MSYPRQLATKAEACEYLHVSQRTLDRFIADGVITGYRIGTKTIRVDLDEIRRNLVVAKPVGGGAGTAP